MLKPNIKQLRVPFWSNYWFSAQNMMCTCAYLFDCSTVLINVSLFEDTQSKQSQPDPGHVV